MSRTRVALLAFCLLAVAETGAAANEVAPASDPAGELAVADWEGSVLARRVRGAVAVLAGGDGSLRWEIATAPDTTLAALLARRGRGWTVVLGPNGQGTRNAWGEEWRGLEPDLARVLAAATRAALADGGSERRRVVLAGSQRPLRDRLVRRGAGRGGSGEILHLEAEPGGGTVIHSTRRPGRLRLSSWRRHAVRYPARESFAPLWPLDELLDFREENGNPGG